MSAHQKELIIRKAAISFATFLVVAMSVYLLSINEGEAASEEICFCHITGSGSETLCTSSSGQQNGHFGHGDVGFGCECGDAVCDPILGEDCTTCPTDCGACVTCGDGTEDVGEECGDGALACPGAGDVCFGCRCITTCGNQLVDPGEQCDSTECCNDNCSLNTGDVCDDSNACTSNETCTDGVCGGGDPVDCSDPDACTTDTCDTTLGCQHAPVFCEDDNACTADNCDSATGCISPSINCDDGDACTVESCDLTQGCDNVPIDCDDAVACTDDSCDSDQGCVHTPDDSLCDDGDPCTVDKCAVIDGCSNTAVSDCPAPEESPSPTNNIAGGDGFSMGCTLIR